MLRTFTSNTLKRTRSLFPPQRFTQKTPSFVGLAFSTNTPEPNKGIPVNVKAYYVSRVIDIFRLHGTRYNFARRDYQTKSVTITLSEELNQHILVFKYGSIVMFNIPEDQHHQHIKSIQDETQSIEIPSSLQHTENYRIIIHENLDKPSVLKAEHVNIRNLDKNNLIVIGTIMAQSVALDYYAVAVEKMLESFMKMNLSIQHSGDFANLSTKELHKLIASNNAVITTVLSKMGIFEGTDAAWDNGDYSNTWDALRKDFEVELRYNDLKTKLDIVKDDAQFFLEVLHNQKSSKLEWVIIILISGEMVIGLCSLYLEFMH